MGGTISNIYHRVAQRIYHSPRRLASKTPNPTTYSPITSKPISASELAQPDPLSFADKIRTNFLAAVEAVKSPIPLNAPDQAYRYNLKTAFVMGTAALASISMTACGVDTGIETAAIGQLVNQGIEFFKEFPGTISVGLTCITMAARLSLESAALRSIKPLRAAAKFGAALLPYTLIPTGVLAFGELKNNIFELALLGSLGLTATSLSTNIFSKFDYFKTFRNNHPTAARVMLISNNLWRAGLIASVTIGGIVLFSGSNDPGDLSKMSELLRYAKGAKELASILANDYVNFKELTVPVTLAAATLLHVISVRAADRLPAQSLFRWPAEKLAFWGNLVYPAIFAELAYLSTTNNSTFNQVYDAWSPNVKDFLLDSAFLGLGFVTYKDIKNSLYTRLGRQFAPAEAAVIIEHALANSQKLAKLALVSIQVPMFASLAYRLFTLDYSQFNDSQDSLANLALNYLTTYFAFNYVMDSAVHSHAHSWGAVRDGQKSVDATEKPRLSASYIKRVYQEGDGIRVLAASMDPQATALVQIYKMLINPVANIEYGDYIETHPHDRLDHTQVVRAHLEFTKLVVDYQKEIYQFIKRQANDFHRAVANGTVNDNLADHYRSLAKIYRAIAERYVKDTRENKEFTLTYKAADYLPGQGDDFETRPSYPLIIRHLEAVDQQTRKGNDRFFKPQRDPYRYACDLAARIRGQEMLSVAEELELRADKQIELTSAELEMEFKYLHSIFAVEFLVNQRHILKQDDRNYNKISNLASPHTFEGDTLYDVWTLSPNYDGNNSIAFEEEEIPSLYICVKNPHYNHNPYENEPKKKFPYFWVHRDDFAKILKYSGSYSDELDLVDNKPDDLEANQVTITINHQDIKAYPAMTAELLPFKRLIYRPELTPSQRAQEDKRVRWVGGETLTDEKWETYKTAFEYWAAKKFGASYQEWINGRRTLYKNPRELWFKPAPGFKFYLGGQFFDDPKVTTLDEEHLSITFELEAKVQADTENNPFIMIPFYFPITRRMENPAPGLGAPQITHVTDYHIDVTYDLKAKKSETK